MNMGTGFDVEIAVNVGIGFGIDYLYSARSHRCGEPKFALPTRPGHETEPSL